jgi:hypothetical protein
LQGSGGHQALDLRWSVSMAEAQARLDQKACSSCILSIPGFRGWDWPSPAPAHTPAPGRCRCPGLVAAACSGGIGVPSPRWRELPPGRWSGWSRCWWDEPRELG